MEVVPAHELAGRVTCVEPTDTNGADLVLEQLLVFLSDVDLRRVGRQLVLSNARRDPVCLPE